MEMAKPLDKEMDAAIGENLNTGYDLMEKGQFEKAEPYMQKAWALFPEPKHQWDSSESTLFNLSAFYLRWKKFDQAIRWAEEVFKCNPLPGSGEPDFTIGKIQYEARDFDKARQHLQKAFDAAGRRVFQEEDPKYFKFLKEEGK